MSDMDSVYFLTLVTMDFFIVTPLRLFVNVRDYYYSVGKSVGMSAFKFGTTILTPYQVELS